MTEPTNSEFESEEKDEYYSTATMASATIKVVTTRYGRPQNHPEAEAYRKAVTSATQQSKEDFKRLHSKPEAVD